MKNHVPQRVGRFSSFGMLALVVATFTASPAAADVYRWDIGALIPGTEGITPGPGVQLDHRELEYANLSQKDLTGANFESSNLANAALYESTLANADLRGVNLTHAWLAFSTLTNANLRGAVVTETRLGYATSTGFTKEQLYSTASYQAKDLHGIALDSNDLSGWNFSGQNLANAELSDSKMTDANLSLADLTDAYLHYSTFTSANLTGANLVNAYFEQSTFTNAKLDFADTRGARFLDLADATSRNAILPDGVIAGLNLAAGEQLVVRRHLGDRPVPVTIHDQMMIENGGVLRIIFDAGPWNSVVSFEPGIPVQLDGTLELTFAHDVDSFAQIGHKLRIFDWTGVEPTGSFQIASPWNWVRWDTDELYTTGEVTLTQVPEPATWTVALIGCLAMFVQRNRCARLRYFPAPR